ncbi:ABC transporter ATP-binding protein [Micromonospora sp. NBC_01796]|uniref:ABC transporter ATP-binding protein n=1 Tax=Micromonospora sp. NBC_01796 TaxID=2975987 RepID=UPI002DDABB39|nr:ABC transporter ATP-binding protein [Micromonospora sp. NBC_01796]
MLSAENLTLSYGSTVALANASATVHRGEVVAFVGPSGSGKSTMLYCMAGLLHPDGGKVSFDGVDLTKLDDPSRSDLRRRDFGFVFQFAELVPELSLRENIMLPLELNGVGRRDRRARVEELLQQLGIEEQADRRPAKVSGGQAQRAAVARAMAHRPRVLFADEPTGALDSQNGVVVLDALLKLASVDDTAVVLVTHDPQVAGRAHRTVRMHDGMAQL